MKEILSSFFSIYGQLGRWDYFKITILFGLTFFVLFVTGAGIVSSIQGGEVIKNIHSFQDLLSLGPIALVFLAILGLLFLYISFVISLKRINDVFETQTTATTLVVNLVYNILSFALGNPGIILSLILFIYPGQSYYSRHPEKTKRLHHLFFPNKKNPEI